MEPRCDAHKRVSREGAWKEYRYRPGAVTSKNARRVRQHTGSGLINALTAMTETPDIDMLATICYAAALQTDFNTASLDEIDEAFSYDADIEIEFPDSDDDDDPEA